MGSAAGRRGCCAWKLRQPQCGGDRNPSGIKGEGSDADGVPRKGFLEWGEVRPGLRDPVSESCSHLTGAETEVQRGHVACLGTHGQREEALGLDPGYLCSQVNSLPTPWATSPSWEQAGSRGFPPDRQGH